MRRRHGHHGRRSGGWCIASAATTLLLAAGGGEAAAQGPGGLPFATMYNRPALSPYTALGFQGGNPLTGATLGALQSTVQPQLQQQAQIRPSMQQARQISQLQRQVRQGRPLGTTQTQTIRGTGCPSLRISPRRSSTSRSAIRR